MTGRPLDEIAADVRMHQIQATRSVDWLVARLREAEARNETLTRLADDRLALMKSEEQGWQSECDELKARNETLTEKSSEYDSLRRELATLLGPIREHHGLSHAALWIEKVAALTQERDEARRTADGMARAPYGEFESMRERMEAAEAALADTRKALERIASIDRGLTGELARRALAAGEGTAPTSSEGRGNREHLSSARAAAPPGPEGTAPSEESS